jgi:hypothetical protein
MDLAPFGKLFDVPVIVVVVVVIVAGIEGGVPVVHVAGVESGVPLVTGVESVVVPPRNLRLLLRLTFLIFLLTI